VDDITKFAVAINAKDEDKAPGSPIGSGMTTRGQGPLTPALSHGGEREKSVR